MQRAPIILAVGAILLVAAGATLLMRIPGGSAPERAKPEPVAAAPSAATSPQERASAPAALSAPAASPEAASAAPSKPQEAAPDPEVGDKPDPRLVVPPVVEPEFEVGSKAEERPDFVAALQGGGYIFERSGSDGKRVTGVVVPGTILVTRGLVELFGCGQSGKEHETVLRLECDAQSLDLALTSAGFTRGRLPTALGIEDPGQGSRVIVLVQWKDKDGKLVTHRSEDLIISIRRNAPMPRVGWTYVAQWAEVQDPTHPKGEKTHKVLAAANSRSFVTTFRDKTALLDNPLEEAVDDTLFAANYMLLPPSGTPVRVIFRPPTDEERREIAALEKELAKQAKDFRPDDREEKEK
jgi:hypothetical protein